MARTLNEMIEGPPFERQREVESQAARLIEEEMTLRDLRKAHAPTRQRMAEALHISQDGVSRIEKRSDFLLSTLRSYIEAMAGELRLAVEFPDRNPVTLFDLAEMRSGSIHETRRRMLRRLSISHASRRALRQVPPRPWDSIS